MELCSRLGLERGEVQKEHYSGGYGYSVIYCHAKNHVDKAMYYDAEAGRISWCGIFNEYSALPEKPYYAFVAFNELKKLGEEVEIEIKEKGIHTLAATNGKETAILLVNYVSKKEGEDKTCTISLENYKKAAKAEVYILDAEHDLELIKVIENPEKNINLYIGRDSVVQAMAIKNSIGGLCGFGTTLLSGKVLGYIQANGSMLFGIPMYGQQFLSAFSCIVFLIAAIFCHKVITKQEVMKQ